MAQICSYVGSASTLKPSLQPELFRSCSAVSFAIPTLPSPSHSKFSELPLLSARFLSSSNSNSPFSLAIQEQPPANRAQPVAPKTPTLRSPQAKRHTLPLQFSNAPLFAHKMMPKSPSQRQSSTKILFTYRKSHTDLQGEGGGSGRVSQVFCLSPRATRL